MRLLGLGLLLAVNAGAVLTLAPQMPPRAPNPTRSPYAPGTPPLTRVADRTNPPADQDGNFLIGPDYRPAPESLPSSDIPQGRVLQFTMRSEDSHYYPGITRVPPGAPANYRPAHLADLRIFPKPYVRTITVYVPPGYIAGTVAPLLVTADGPALGKPDRQLPAVLDHLIAEHRIPALVAVMIQNGGGDAQGSERGLEYDTVSPKYGEFVEREVLPRVESKARVTISHDPDRRATMGGSSGGAAAFTMAWFHPDWYHRVITFSGTYVNQAWPVDPKTPHGAWEYHDHLIMESPKKPLRVWLEVGDRDNLTRHDGFHDWVIANNRMATVLKAKGYAYQYVFALNAGHTDRRVKAQILPEALEWVWR